MTRPPDNSDPRDYILDLSTSSPSSPELHNSEFITQNSARKAAFLSIHFKCCNTYARIYRNSAATAYAGHCPRCNRPLTVGISPDGSTKRTFTAG